MESGQTAPELDALLQEEHAPWEALDDDLEAGGSSEIKLKSLFSSHPDQVLRSLQQQGVRKLGEFRERSDIAFAAFKGHATLTLGSSHRSIDYETVWRNELRRLKNTSNDTASWTGEVKLEAFQVNIAHAADPDKDGLIQPLLRRWQNEACSLAVFGVPCVQATITFKWQAFAKKLLLWELAIFLVWLLCFYGFAAVFQDEDLTLSLGQLLQTPRGIFTVVLEVLCLLAMVPFLVLEQGTLAAYGVAGWFSIYNALDIATYIIQFAVSFLHLTRWNLKSDTLSILLALQCIFLLFRLQYYSRVFKSTRFSFLDAIKDVFLEIRSYFLFLLLIIFGFASAFHILFRKSTDQDVTNFDTLPHALLKVYSAAQSGLDFSEMLASHVPVFASLLNVAYAFVMGMVLMNLLIGIMSNALNKVTEHEALKLLLHKAQIIDELEATLPRWLENKFQKEWYPRHVHVLRIDPDSVERVDLEGLWAQKNDGNGAGEKTSGGGEGADANLAAKMDEIQAAIAVLTAEVQKIQQQQQQGGEGRASAGPTTPEVSVL